MGWIVSSQETLSQSSPVRLTKEVDADLSGDCCHDEETSISSSTTTPSRLAELKSELRGLLFKNGGSTKEPDVMSVIEELIKMKPCVDVAETTEFLGEFSSLTCPNFPGRIEQQTPGKEHIAQYSLGRMSFNIFQPNKLVCTIRGLRNEVIELGGTKDGKRHYSYNLISDITIHTDDGDLPAILINEAKCYEHSEIRNRLIVTFTGGTLLPTEDVLNDTVKLTLWSKTFERAYQKADEQRSYVGWIVQFFVKLLMGLTYPTDEALAKHCFHFDMTRSPLGYLDCLYLDEDLRITRGNRGTIVVVERSSELQ